MYPPKEIEDAIDSAASSIMETLDQQVLEPTRSRKSLLLARIDLEFALGVTHLMINRGAGVNSRTDARRMVDTLDPTAQLNRVRDWLEEAKSHLAKSEYEEAEIRLAAAIRVRESQLKAFERKRAKSLVGRSARASSSSAS